MLSPLANLLNLSSLTLLLNKNKIRNLGAKSLFKSLTYFLNLSRMSLDLSSNNINDKGAWSLFYPLSNLIRLSSLHLRFDYYSLTKHTEHLFKNYFKQLKSFQFYWICIDFIFFCYLSMVNQHLELKGSILRKI